MDTNRIEELYNAERRRADRDMIFAALRDRRGSVGPRRLLGALLWVFGIR